MDADQAGMMRVSAEGIDMSENGQQWTQFVKLEVCQMMCPSIF